MCFLVDFPSSLLFSLDLILVHLSVIFDLIMISSFSKASFSRGPWEYHTLVIFLSTTEMISLCLWLVYLCPWVLYENQPIAPFRQVCPLGYRIVSCD